MPRRVGIGVADRRSAFLVTNIVRDLGAIAVDPGAGDFEVRSVPAASLAEETLADPLVLRILAPAEEFPGGHRVARSVVNHRSDIHAWLAPTIASCANERAERIGHLLTGSEQSTLEFLQVKDGIGRRSLLEEHGWALIQELADWSPSREVRLVAYLEQASGMQDIRAGVKRRLRAPSATTPQAKGLATLAMLDGVPSTETTRRLAELMNRRIDAPTTSTTIDELEFCLRTARSDDPIEHLLGRRASRVCEAALSA